MVRVSNSPPTSSFSISDLKAFKYLSSSVWNNFKRDQAIDDIESNGLFDPDDCEGLFDAINKNGVVALQEKIKSSYSVSNTIENTTGAENVVEETNNTENSTANSTDVEVETNSTNTTNTESQE